MNAWFLRSEGSEPIGPVSTELVVRGILAGRVPPDAEVALEFPDGTSPWRPLGRVPEFAAALRESDPAWQPSPEWSRGRSPTPALPLSRAALPTPAVPLSKVVLPSPAVPLPRSAAPPQAVPPSPAVPLPKPAPLPKPTVPPLRGSGRRGSDPPVARGVPVASESAPFARVAGYVEAAWYVQEPTESAALGPLSTVEIARRISAWTISADALVSLVSPYGSADWRPLDAVAEFAAACRLAHELGPPPDALPALSSGSALPLPLVPPPVPLPQPLPSAPASLPRSGPPPAPLPAPASLPRSGPSPAPLHARAPAPPPRLSRPASARPPARPSEPVQAPELPAGLAGSYWYVLEPGAVTPEGPFEDRELRARVARGGLPHGSRVARPGTRAWKPID